MLTELSVKKKISLLFSWLSMISIAGCIDIVYIQTAATELETELLLFKGNFNTVL